MDKEINDNKKSKNFPDNMEDAYNVAQNVVDEANKLSMGWSDKEVLTNSYTKKKPNSKANFKAGFGW